MSTQQSQTGIQQLITLERVQKLDLLIHLVSNLSQSLIICGPEGIGKTTILDALIAHKKDAWPICMMQGGSSLSFESILDKFLQQLIQVQAENAGQNLAAILERYNKQNQKVVLVIDDAGLLVPGLISALIEFAHGNSCLRLVLSLTHDELHIKNSSDRFIDDCHLIEIPPLSKKQCMLFLQNLSAQPGSVISFNAVTEGFVDNLYRKTHGIPGKIVAELPQFARYQPTTGLKWGMGILVMFAALGSGLFFYLNNKPDPQRFESLKIKALVKKKAVAVEISSPLVQLEKGEQVDNEVKVYQKQEGSKNNVVISDDGNNVLLGNEEKIAVDKKEPLIAKDKAVEIIKPVQRLPERIVEDKEKIGQKIAPVENQAEKPVVEEKTEKMDAVPKTEKTNVDVVAWVKSQPPESYTIQLMVLSKRQSAEKLFKKYPAYNELLKYFQIKKQGQSQYVVIYGSYKNSADAVNAKQALPAVFRKGWVRKFKVLQKQM